MALSLFGRVILRLRKMTAHTAAFVLFSGLLTYLFVLYQPTKGPGDTSQDIGWQSWETVSNSNDAAQESGQDGMNAVTPNSTEWWELEALNETKFDTTSLPLDYWAPLLPHDTGLTEIAVMRCMVPPWLFPKACEPKSSLADDANKGKWVRVDRDLNRKSGTWYLNMYYRRTRKLDVPLITELRLLPKDGEASLPNRESWYSAGTSLRDGVLAQPPLFLWFKLGPTLRQLNGTQGRNLITELDVIYGAGPPMYGFETLEPTVTAGKKGQVVPVRVAFRRGPPSIPRAPPLHFNHNGTYKILQVADLHFSVSHGMCRDTDRVPCDHADDITNDLLASVLDIEQPDLVVFTGDQLNGQGTSWDSRSVLAKFATTVIQRKLPWAVVFGNHDSETDMPRDVEMKHLTQLPYFMGSAGPPTVHGVGNYVLKVHSADPSKTHLLTLYFLDSGSYYKGVYDFFGFFRPTSYDFLRDTQIEWFLTESAKISPIQRPHTPDGASDLGTLSGRQAVPNARLAKPNALMFFHIPLQESYNQPDIDLISSKRLDVGEQLEGSGASKKNEGFFEKALLSATESENSTSLEVKVVGNGHCHVSENCRRVRGVWLCFGGGGSFAGYGKIGFDRRFRVYSISEYGETIRTYKRTEHGEVLDDMLVAGEGSATPSVR